MQNLWKDPSGTELEQLAYASRLLGTEPELVLAGGGNSSLKAIETDVFGRRAQILYVKPSGIDMAGIEAADFTALRLADLEPLLERDPMDDDAMLDCVRRAQVDPDARRPSIETLLHAFVPDRWVLHSHADALLALSNRPDGPARLIELLGTDVAVVAYCRPGSKLAHSVAAARRGNPTAKGIVLHQHGLVTFGASARQAYERHIQIVTACEVAAPLPPPGPAPEPDRARAIELAPRLRRPGFVMSFDDSPEVLAFLGDEALVAAASRGPATADHLITTGRAPAIMSGPEDAGEARVLFAPGVGMWTVGENVETAKLARDITLHTMRMIRRAGVAWDPLSSEHVQHAEDWPLQTRKRGERADRGELAGKVAWISGAANGIGRAIADRFAAEGAHLVLTDIEAIDSAGPRVVTLECDVADEQQVQASFDRTVLEFGGIDIVVSNAGIAKPATVENLTLFDWERSFAVNATGHFLVARAAMRIFRAQGIGGSMVFNASKNVLAPGKGFGAYSAAKAAEAQLAKVLALEGGEIGVRVNTLHPDAVFAGTKLWSQKLREERAAAHGVPVDEIEDFYAKRNLLGLPVRPEDVAEAALFFASARSSRTTGAFLTIDGGVKSAFPR